MVRSCQADRCVRHNPASLLAAEKIQPYGIELGDGRKLWRWNERDIAEGRKLRASQKDGPKTHLRPSDIAGQPHQMDEAKRPRFQLLVSAKPRTCMARSCPNEADYWAVWALLSLAGFGNRCR